MRWEVEQDILEVQEFPYMAIAKHICPVRYARLLVDFHTLRRGQIMVLVMGFFTASGLGSRLPVYILANKYYPPEEGNQRMPEDDNNWCIPFVFFGPASFSPERVAL